MKSLLLACAAVGLATPACAMDYSFEVYRNQLVVHANGQITDDKSWLYTNFIITKLATNEPRPIVSIIFNSPGGSPNGALVLGDMIGRFHLNTGVEHGGQCVSACVLAWGRGAHKSVSTTSAVGVHQVQFNPAGPVTLADASGFISYNGKLAKFLQDDGAPYSVVYAAVNTPPDQVYWLTPADYAAWNVNIVQSPPLPGG